MGLFGAITTAVGGLRAQAFALENISGNIANSQTTGFKRIDTSFADMVPDSVPSLQLAGGVLARSRSTNNVQGDIQNASVNTFMAINGAGYFIVQKPSAFPDGTPVFTGVDLFTRRGDFQLDKDGYLVNGAGYYLKVLRVDGTTGNVIGNVPEVLQFSNDFLPARPTTLVEYRANLASFPRTAQSNVDIPGSERLNVNAFSTNPTRAGTGTVTANDAPLFIEQSIAGGAITVYDTVGSPANIQLRWAKLADEVVNVVGSPIVADTPAAGTGAVNIAADVVSTTNATAFNPANFQGEALATLTLNTGSIASMADGDTFSFNFGGTTYTFQSDPTNGGVPSPNIGFDGTHAGLESVLQGLFGAGGSEFQGNVAAGANSITITAAPGSTNNFENLVAHANLGLTNTAYGAPSVFTISDGVTTANFTYVTGGGNPANGTFSDINELIAAINHGSSALAGVVSASAAGGTGLRIFGNNDSVTFTLGGNAATALGMTGSHSTANYNADIAALAGQALTVNGTTVNIADTTTRATLEAALSSFGAAFNGSGQLELTSANAMNITGGAAAALGFGPGNNSFEPFNPDLNGLAGTLVLQHGSGPNYTISFGPGVGQVNNRAELEAELAAAAAATGLLLSINANGEIEVSSATDATVSIGGTAAAALGLPTDTFQGNLTPRWELFYLENSNATGNQVAWRNAGVTYTFDSAGRMTSDTQVITLQNVVVNGVPLGEVTVSHGDQGVTQFSDVNGNAQVNLIRQNGYPAGHLQDIAVNEKGRIIANYSNNRTLEIAEIVLASFNSDNALKRLDGGAFEPTSESGVPTYGATGKILAKSLEGSNTDIADEFTKLIVTQQAYAANTRIVTTGDQMLQETLNMVR